MRGYGGKEKELKASRRRKVRGEAKVHGVYATKETPFSSRKDAAW